MTVLSLRPVAVSWMDMGTNGVPEYLTQIVKAVLRLKKVC